VVEKPVEVQCYIEKIVPIERVVERLIPSPPEII